MVLCKLYIFFFLNDPAPPEIYTLPLHAALPISLVVRQAHQGVAAVCARHLPRPVGRAVIADEPLDGVEALDLARQVRQRLRQLLRLVEAWNLDDELHRDHCLDLASGQYPKAQAMSWAPGAWAAPCRPARAQG